MNDGSEQFTMERQDVWFWLAEMFLDTEMLESDKDLLAERLASTSFSLEQLDQIMRAEVAPILHGNLMMVAGQWGCWNRKEEVIKPITAHVNALSNSRYKGLRWIQKCLQAFYMMNVNGEWAEILVRLSKMRSSDDQGKIC